MIAPPKPPSHDELEALIKEARARQLRRRLLAAAGIALVAALGLAVYAIASGGNQLSRSAAQSRPASVPFCRSAQLSGSTGFQGATGTMLGFVTLRNEADVACSLPQKRPLMSISWRGKVIPTEEHAMLTGPPWPRAHELAPGQKASVFWQWLSCGGVGAPQVAVRPTLTLRFGHGLVVRARADESTPPSCSGLRGRRFLDVTHVLVYR
jgi:hypothetical protein